jgi:uncharacterized Zn finger protein (UPF0148 family)
MTACARCNAPLPPRQGKGRPRIYCPTCAPIVKRETSYAWERHRSKKRRPRGEDSDIRLGAAALRYPPAVAALYEAVRDA